VFILVVSREYAWLCTYVYYSNLQQVKRIYLDCVLCPVVQDAKE